MTTRFRSFSSSTLAVSSARTLLRQVFCRRRQCTQLSSCVSARKFRRQNVSTSFHLVSLLNVWQLQRLVVVVGDHCTSELTECRDLVLPRFQHLWRGLRRVDGGLLQRLVEVPARRKHGGGAACRADDEQRCSPGTGAAGCGRAQRGGGAAECHVRLAHKQLRYSKYRLAGC